MQYSVVNSKHSVNTIIKYRKLSFNLQLLAQKKNGIATMPAFMENSLRFWWLSFVYSKPAALINKKQRQETKYLSLKACLNNVILSACRITIPARVIVAILLMIRLEKARLISEAANSIKIPVL